MLTYTNNNRPQYPEDITIFEDRQDVFTINWEYSQYTRSQEYDEDIQLIKKLLTQEEREKSKLFWYNPKSIKYKCKVYSKTIKRVIRDRLLIKYRND